MKLHELIRDTRLLLIRGYALDEDEVRITFVGRSCDINVEIDTVPEIVFGTRGAHAKEEAARAMMKALRSIVFEAEQRTMHMCQQLVSLDEKYAAASRKKKPHLRLIKNDSIDPKGTP